MNVGLDATVFLIILLLFLTFGLGNGVLRFRRVLGIEKRLKVGDWVS